MIGILKRFWRDELGGFTPGFLFFFLAVIVVFGMAMNVKGTRIQKKRIEGVAQAIALELVRGINNPHITREAAVERAFQTGWFASGANLDVGVAAMRSGTSSPSPKTLVLEDVTSLKYGRYDPDTLAFIEDSASTEAVMVEMEFSKVTGHQLLHRFYTGLDPKYDLSVRAVAQSYVPDCSRYGIFGNDLVRVHGRLELGANTCLRANRRTDLRSGIDADRDATISVVSQDRMLSSGFNRISPRSLEYRTLRRSEFYDFDRIFDGFASGSPSVFKPTFVLAPTVRVLDAHAELPISRNRDYYLLDQAQIPSGQIVHIMNCRDERTVRFRGGDYVDIVVLSECPVEILGQANLVSGVLMVNNSESRSIYFRGNASIGDAGQACSDTAGMTVWSAGQIAVQEDLVVNGGHLISGRLNRDPISDPFNPDPSVNLEPDINPSTNAWISVGKRAFLHGSSLTAHMGVITYARTVVTPCPDRNNGNRYFRPHFRVGLI